MHPKISGFKLNAFRRKWAGLLVAVCAATVIAFAIAPLLTQANLLNAPVEEVTVTFTEGTNMAAAPSPDGKTIILAVQGSLWSIPSSGGGARLLSLDPSIRHTTLFPQKLLKNDASIVIQFVESIAPSRPELTEANQSFSEGARERFDGEIFS